MKAGQIRPGFVPIQPQKGDLSTKEKAQTQKSQTSKLNQQKAANLAGREGFQRSSSKKGKGINIGDSSRAPIPLPDDETNTEAWNQETLTGAQENLSMAAGHFDEVTKANDEVSMGASVVGASFLPTEKEIKIMQNLADRPAPEPIPMDEVTTNVELFFDIKLNEDVPLGHKVLAAGLVVAGESGSVKVKDGKIKEKDLADGVQKVSEKGNQAVGQAQRMNKGVDRELNLQRTFVFRR